jgi:uncharacterized protein YqeY
MEVAEVKCRSARRAFDMLLREHLKADLKRAMKARESQTVTTLRSLLSAIDNAEAVDLDTSHVPVVGQANDVPRKALSEAQQRDILKGEAEELRLAIGEYEKLDRPEEVKDLARALDLVLEYTGEVATLGLNT